MTIPVYLQPFVVPTKPVTVIDVGGFDVYVPSDAAGPAPVTVLVHGGPFLEAPAAPPRQWPVFRGYGAALAARGIAAVMFDHVLLRSVGYAAACAQLDATVTAAKALSAVDADRVALWFFSGGGPLAAWALRTPPPGLRAIALSYPMLRPMGPVSGFSPAAELGSAGHLPILLTRVGLESPELATTQAEFINAAHAVRADLKVIDVPDGHHSFDIVDDSDQSRHAITEAIDFLHARLTGGGLQ